MLPGSICKWIGTQIIIIKCIINLGIKVVITATLRRPFISIIRGPNPVTGGHHSLVTTIRCINPIYPQRKSSLIISSVESCIIWYCN